MGKSYSQLATDIITLVGGKENVSYATHCATRLRLNLKDESIVDDEKLKRLQVFWV